MILWVSPSLKRLWFEGTVQRREALGGVKWNLNTCEHPEEDAGGEREFEDARDHHLGQDGSRWFLLEQRGQPQTRGRTPPSLRRLEASRAVPQETLDGGG